VRLTNARIIIIIIKQYELKVWMYWENGPVTSHLSKSFKVTVTDTDVKNCKFVYAFNAHVERVPLGIL